jgi:hypothetical protein
MSDSIIVNEGSPTCTHASGQNTRHAFLCNFCGFEVLSREALLKSLQRGENAPGGEEKTKEG